MKSMNSDNLLNELVNRRLKISTNLPKGPRMPRIGGMSMQPKIKPLARIGHRMKNYLPKL